MKKVKLVIHEMLPDLNDYIGALNASPYAGARMKKRVQEGIEWEALAQIKIKFDGKRPVYMSYLWVERNTRRDKDNIAFAKKFIQDALVETGILKNDGWRQVCGFEDHFTVDSKHPRVEVIIEEVKEG